MKLSKYTKGRVMAVGHWVETISDKTPDLCNCNPDSMGQDGLTDEQICANARRIAACWTAFGGMTTEEIEAICSEGGVKSVFGARRQSQPKKLRPFSSLPDEALVRQSQLVTGKRNPGVPTVLPFSPATLWRRVADGSFPKPVDGAGSILRKNGKKSITAWRVKDVRSWLAAQEIKGDT